MPSFRLITLLSLFAMTAFYTFIAITVGIGTSSLISMAKEEVTTEPLPLQNLVDKAQDYGMLDFLDSTSENYLDVDQIFDENDTLEQIINRDSLAMALQQIDLDTLLSQEVEVPIDEIATELKMVRWKLFLKPLGFMALFLFVLFYPRFNS